MLTAMKFYHTLDGNKAYITVGSRLAELQSTNVSELFCNAQQRIPRALDIDFARHHVPYGSFEKGTSLHYGSHACKRGRVFGHAIV